MVVASLLIFTAVFDLGSDCSNSWSLHTCYCYEFKNKETTKKHGKQIHIILMRAYDVQSEHSDKTTKMSDASVLSVKNLCDLLSNESN